MNKILDFFNKYYKNGMLTFYKIFEKQKNDIELNYKTKDSYYIKTIMDCGDKEYKVKDLTFYFKTIYVDSEIFDAKKRFVLANDYYKKINNNTYEIYFEYKYIDNDKKQREINKDILEKIYNMIGKYENDIKKIINNYTKNKRIEYFIHKDLKTYLETELRYYMFENEIEDFEVKITEDIVNDLIDILTYKVSYNRGLWRFFNYRRNNIINKLNKTIGNNYIFSEYIKYIINVLYKLEEFQKGVWNSVDFKTKDYYVISLDYIQRYCGNEFLESILDDIINNKEQLEEWEKLFNVYIKDKNDLLENNNIFSEKKYKKLPIDTKYFGKDFQNKLLNKISEKYKLKDVLNGILIKSDNYRALNYLKNDKEVFNEN